jgi:hypothetical protein
VGLQVSSVLFVLHTFSYPKEEEKPRLGSLKRDPSANMESYFIGIKASTYDLDFELAMAESSA